MPYTKTPLGQLAFKERSPLLSNRQRSLFLLFDGTKSVDQVLVITKALSITQADIDHLLSSGFIVSTGDVAVPAAGTPATVTQIAPSQSSDTAASPNPAGSAASASTSQERFARAWPIATQLTAGMGIRGFRLNLAIEGATGYDDLLALLPKIQAAVGKEKCVSLEKALKA